LYPFAAAYIPEKDRSLIREAAGTRLDVDLIPVLMEPDEFAVQRLAGGYLTKEKRCWLADNLNCRVTKNPEDSRIRESNDVLFVHDQDAIRACICQGLELHFILHPGTI